MLAPAVLYAGLWAKHPVLLKFYDTTQFNEGREVHVPDVHLKHQQVRRAANYASAWLSSSSGCDDDKRDVF